MPTNNKTNSTEKKTTTPKTQNSEAKKIAELEEMIKKLTEAMSRMQAPACFASGYVEIK